MIGALYLEGAIINRRNRLDHYNLIVISKPTIGKGDPGPIHSWKRDDPFSRGIENSRIIVTEKQS